MAVSAFDRLAELVSLPADRFRVDARHVHEWRRLASTCGFFECDSCSWFAVCPGCLQSLSVGLQVQQGLVGLCLFWCSSHGGLSGLDEIEQMFQGGV